MFHLVEEADAGDLVGQQPIPIELEDDATSLYDKVVDAGRELIRDYYPALARGEVPRTPQDESKATWWPKREPHHELIDWTRSACELYDWIRGQTRPYPGAFTFINGRKVVVWGAKEPTGVGVFAKPGEILGTNSASLAVAAWEETIELTSVQVESEATVTGASLLENYDIKPGDTFENQCDQLRRGGR